MTRQRMPLLSWLRGAIVNARAADTLCWQRPHYGQYQHAKLAPDSQAAVCGRYASRWIAVGGSADVLPRCGYCVDLLEQSLEGSP